MHRAVISLALAAVLLAATAASAKAGARPYDLNGDGRQEIVAGLPWWSDAATSQGAVVVLPGDADRLFGSPIVLDHASLGVPETSAYDELGRGIASGDFDNDQRADLAIGAPGLFTDPDDPQRARGGVIVMYGDEAIPGDRRSTLPGPPTSRSNPFGHFGQSLVAGDLNADGFADLVIGATSEDPVGDGTKGGGGIYVLWGSAAGLASGQPIGRPLRSNVAFGSHFALGNLDGGRRLDLFEGAPGSLNTSGKTWPGHLNQVSASPTGTPTLRIIRRAMKKGGPSSMAMGDVTGDGFDDLVLGISRNRFYSGLRDAPPGEITIWRGGRRGLGTSTRPIRLDQNSPWIPGNNQRDDLFGSAVFVTRVDRDRYADMVVGAYGEDRSAGRVTIIRGGRRGYSRKGNRTIERGMKGVPGTVKDFPWFGKELSVLDVNGDGRRDLLVGAPGDHYGAGSINVFPAFRTKHARVFEMRSLGGSRPSSESYGTLHLGRVDGD